MNTPQKTEQGTAKPSPSFSIRPAAYLEVSDRTIRFCDEDNELADTQVYSGVLLPGVASLSITGFINKILSTFSLTLPSGFPDIIIDSLSGKVTRQQVTKNNETTTKSRYEFSAGSSTLATYPFGHSIPITSFTQFEIKLKSGDDQAAKYIFLTADVNFDTSVITWLSNINALVVFAENNSVIGFEINQTVSSAQIIEQLFSIQSIPDEIKTFLPGISPLSASQPIRFYRASSDMDITQAAPDGTQIKRYQKGFNLDQCIINVLNHDFSLILNVDNGFTIGAGIESLDLGIVVLNVPAHPTSDTLLPGLSGPIIQITSHPVSIQLASQLVFFTTVPLDLTAKYTQTDKTFRGQVQYDKKILGEVPPPFIFSWSKKNGFQIESFPIPEKYLKEFIDFASEIKSIVNAAKNPNGCAQLVNFTFSKTVTTKFKLNVKPTSSSGKPAISVGGTYSLFIAGHAISDIAFNPMNVPITVPKNFDDLGNAIVDTLKNSAGALVQALYDNQKQFVELLAIQGLKTGAKQAASSFICRYGEKALENLVKDAAETAADAALDGAMTTLAGAASVFVAAGAALSFFAKIGKCLTGSQKDKRDEAKAKQKKAREQITKLLEIKGLSASYQLNGNQLEITATWQALPTPKEGSISISFTLKNNAGQVVHTDASLAGSTTRKTVVNLSANEKYTAVVQGIYNYQGKVFSGNDSQTQSVPIPSLQVNSPNANYDATNNLVSATWHPSQTFTPNGSVLPITVTEYQVTFWDETAKQLVSGMSQTIDPSKPLSADFNLVMNAEPYFKPDATHQYAVRIETIASKTVFNSPVWQSPSFNVGVGIGHTLLGKTFEVG